MESSTSSLRLLVCTALLFLIQPIYYSQVVAINEAHCNDNCTEWQIEEICGTNGKTYNNTCEMNKDSCLTGEEIYHQYDGPCEVILHIVKGETCSIHKQTVINFKKDVGDSARVQEWNKRCNATHLWGKVQNGTLTARDMLECYIPTCDTEIYSSRQSFKLSDPSDLWGEVRKYYWCSGPTGMYIDGTLSNDRDSMNCSHRKSCQYEGNVHPDGADFKPSHQCGICECLDGEVICFEDFVPDVEGRLNSSQLNKLSDLLKQFFYFETDLRDSIIHDIRKISAMISEIPEQVQSDVLKEWFHRYDNNGNELIQLNHFEETDLHNHLSLFTSCKHFLDHVSEELDMNNSGDITKEEWLEFFAVYTTNTSDISKRAAPEGVTAPRRRRRSLENRKKFYYVTI